MPKMTFREFLEIESEKKDDFQIIPLEDPKSTVKLLSLINKFISITDEKTAKKVMHSRVSIIVDGELKEPDIWPYIYVEEDTEIIITPKFGKGKGAGILFAIGLMTLGALAIAFAPAIASATAIAGATIVKFGMGLMMSGVGMLLQSMFAPDLPSIPEVSGGGGKETKTYTWSGLRSLARIGVPVPVLIGTHKIGGYIIQLYTRKRANETYLYMLLLLSEGEIDGICQAYDHSKVCTTSNPFDSDYAVPAIEINGQLIDRYHDIKWWARNGTNKDDDTKSSYDCTVQNPIPYFNETRIQYEDGREIYDQNGIIFTTRSETDRVELTIMAPALYQAIADQQNQATIFGEQSVYYKIEYKKTTDSTWTTFHPEYYLLLTLCENLTVDSDGNAVCSLGGSANFANCAKVNKVCSFSPTKYKDQTYVNEIVFENGGTISYSMTFPTNAIIIRLKRKREEMVGGGNPIYVKYEYYTDDGLAHYAWHYDYQYVMIFEFEVIIGTMHYSIQRNVYQYRKKYISMGNYHPEFDSYQYPETYTFSILGINIVTNNYQNMIEYNANDPVASRLGEIVLYIIKHSTYTDDYIKLSNASRDPIFDSQEITFPTLDKYDIKVSRYGKTSTSATISDMIKLKDVTEVFSDGLIYPNSALLGLEIKATEQLSGSTPNVLVYARGIKVDVPQIDNGNIPFDNCFWNDGSEYFENIDGSGLSDGIGTDWDDTTFVNEYSENFAAHVKNIMTNERYGIGRYLKDSDINFDSYIETLKDCHIKYDCHSHDGIDYVNWEETSDSHWVNRLVLAPDTRFFPDNGTLIEYGHIDSANRKVYTEFKYGASYDYEILLKIEFLINLISKLKSFNYMTLEITVNNLNTENNLYLMVYAYKAFTNTTWEEVYTGDVVPVSHKISVSFYCPENTTDLAIRLTRSDARTQTNPITGHLIGEITNVTLTESTRDHFHTANGIMERSQNADALLNEMCNSFRCWLISYGDSVSFKLNKDETPVHKISSTQIIENSFSQQLANLSSIPYLLDAQFSDATRDYSLNQRTGIVSVVEANHSTRKSIGLKYIVHPEKIEREIKFQAKQLEEIFQKIFFKSEIEFVHATAGDLFYFEHPLPVWGDGKDGRIIAYNAGVSVTIDEDYVFDGTSSYSILYQDINNTLVSASITNSDSTTDIVTLASWPGNPIEDSSYIIASSSSFHTFRMLSVVRDKNNLLNCTAINHGVNAYNLTDASILDSDVGSNPLSESINIKTFTVQYFPGSGVSGNFSFTVEIESVFGASVVIQFSENNTTGFQTVAVIQQGSNTASWYVSGLVINQDYYFKAIATNQYASSEPVVTSCKVFSGVVALSPPTGLRIFGSSVFTSNFNTKDLVLLWNSVSIAGANYIIRVWKDSETQDNLLVSDRVITTNSFTYLLADNIADNGGTPASHLIIRVATSINTGSSNQISSFSSSLDITNSVPQDLSSISTSSIVGGVSFFWNQSSEEDHKTYYIRTKVSTGNWSSWFENDSNSYTYQLSSSEISSYGTNATIYIEVKDKDWYEQLSLNAISANDAANTVRDSIFAMDITAESGSGNLSQLVDGDTSSGGWTI